MNSASGVRLPVVSASKAMSRSKPSRKSGKYIAALRSTPILPVSVIGVTASDRMTHGHTPLAQCVPDVQSNRINIDTALVFGGGLTAAAFENSQAEAVDLLQVKTMSLEQQI